MRNLASAAAQSDSMVAREVNANAQTAPSVSLNAQHSTLQNSLSIDSYDEYRKLIQIKQTYVMYDQLNFMFDSQNPTQPQDTTSKLGPHVSFSSSNVTLTQSLFNLQRGANQQSTSSNKVTLAQASSNFQAQIADRNNLAQTLWPSLFQQLAPSAPAQTHHQPK